MNILENKYKDFEFSSEFPDLYMLLLYESGGDFKTFSSILGYSSYPDFIKDFEEFELKYKDKFIEYDITTFGQ